MLRDSSGDLVDYFALVTYIPDPLGKFLDDLRRELVPGCVPHAHVTILPPRRLSATPRESIEAVRSLVSEATSFEIETGQVQVFPESDVVYLGIGRGHTDLLQMHKAMSVGPLHFEEPFLYHPHITLAQNLTHKQSVELAALARRRWSEYSGPRGFRAESLVFVRNTALNSWADLAHFRLEATPSVRR